MWAAKRRASKHVAWEQHVHGPLTGSQATAPLAAGCCYTSIMAARPARRRAATGALLSDTMLVVAGCVPLSPWSKPWPRPQGMHEGQGRELN